MFHVKLEVLCVVTLFGVVVGHHRPENPIPYMHFMLTT
jgi:hypothetical protein